MNTNDKLKHFFDRLKSKDCEENEYNQELKIAKTIYPKGQKQMSLNGGAEWYGIQEGEQLKLK